MSSMPMEQLALYALLGVLAIVGVAFTAAWVAAARKARATLSHDDPAAEDGPPSISHLAIGFVTNFFDTLGIGSFAPTTAWFKLRRVVPDRILPGTLNVGHTAPVIVQAFIYTVIIEVDMITLVVLIGAAVAGAWLGAGVVASWPKPRKAFAGTGLETLVDALDGPSAVAWGGDSVVVVARELVDWAKKLDELELKAAVLDGQLFEGEAGVKRLSTFPTKIEAQAKVVQLCLSPASNVVGAAKAPGSNILGIIKELQDRLEKGQTLTGSSAP